MTDHLADNPAFLSRVQDALIQVALAVANEDPGDNHARYQKRTAYSAAVLHNQEAHTKNMARAVSSELDDDDPSDTDIRDAVTNVYDAFAGVTKLTGDPPEATGEDG